MFFISNLLERVCLEGHTATSLYQNPTVIESSVVNTKYQEMSRDIDKLNILCYYCCYVLKSIYIYIV